MRQALLAASLLMAGCATPSQPPAGLALPDPLRALGNEPFWAAVIAGNALTYMTPEDQGGTRIAVQRSDSAQATVFSGTLGSAPLVLRITPGPCSDGMSDRTYPYTAQLTLGAELRQGCAIAQSGWPPPER